ncbi:MAG: GGDEF and EAL domain-containing protein [Hyphomicrobiales bacterium]|nr:GGDEF and EAL domain-containing protein [Hyphomicrobiales bacterium]
MSSSGPSQPIAEAVRPERVSQGPPRDSTPSSDPPSYANGKSFNVDQILTSVGETAYAWNLMSDEVAWAENALEVLQIADARSIASGRAYNMLIDPDHAEMRARIFSELEGDAGASVPYRVQYRLKPAGRRHVTALWVEDHGVWYPGPDGRPMAARGVMRVINDRYEYEQRLLFLSRHDELTGQMNRIMLTEAVRDLLEEAIQTRKSGAFIMASIANLNHINETYGFGLGDEVIAIVGQRLRSCLRDGDSIGRYGSNKFGIVLQDAGLKEIDLVSGRLLEAVRESVIETSAGALSSTVCLGGVLVPRQAQTVEQVFSRSLEALETAKVERRGRFVIYTPSERRESLRARNIALADEVISALNERRMVLALQAVVSSGQRQPMFYECLLRMRKPNGSVVSAGEFIPVAERLGLARLIDHRVVELAVQLLKAAPRLRLAMNVSGETATDPEWLVVLRGLTAEDRSLTERLMVEITETAAISDLEESVRFVESLKSLGCQVAIDDFGAGYSSFRNLRLLDIDVVKIDGTFVRDLPNSRDDQILVRSLIDLARSFGIETVAEWVEDDATARMLEAAGVTYMQGFYFGKPQLIAQPDGQPRVTHATSPLP